MSTAAQKEELELALRVHVPKVMYEIQNMTQMGEAGMEGGRMCRISEAEEMECPKDEGGGRGRQIWGRLRLLRAMTLAGCQLLESSLYPTCPWEDLGLNGTAGPHRGQSYNDRGRWCSLPFHTQGKALPR